MVSFEDAPLGLNYLKELTPRWYPLRIVDPLAAILKDSYLGCGRGGAYKRFLVATAGRRLGKTEWAKREGCMWAFNCQRPDGKVIFSAPTADQAKRIYWSDLKAMVPDFMLRRSRAYSIYESYPQRIELANGCDIMVIGMDKAQRLEGVPVDWICLDEYADMKAAVWSETVRPLVETAGRKGVVRFIGKPRGRNHYWRLVRSIKMGTANPTFWAAHAWSSREVLSPIAIEEMKADMDERTFRQEVDAEFVDFAGRAYYAFEDDVHLAHPLTAQYDPNRDLCFCFDFNIKPGVAVVVQERRPTPMIRAHLEGQGLKPRDTIACAIDEVFMEEGSNTERVALALANRYRGHGGTIRLYGDATGGARKSSGLAGSDWDIVRDVMHRQFGRDRVVRCYPNANPEERVRINAMNRLLRTFDGSVGCIISESCDRLAMDLAGVQINDRTQRIDKLDDPTLTHISDAIGYYAAERWPAGGADEVLTMR